MGPADYRESRQWSGSMTSRASFRPSTPRRSLPRTGSWPWRNSSTLDAQSAGLLLADGAGRSIKSASLPPDAQNAYSEYYCQIDYVLDAVEKGPLGLIRSGLPLVAFDARSEFNADFMRPYQMDDGLFVRLTDGSMPTCYLVAPPKRSVPFDTADRVKLMCALVPHLQQALRTQGHLEDSLKARAHRPGRRRVRHGFVGVGAASVVLHLNSSAERLLKSGDGLNVDARATLKRLVLVPTPSCAAVSRALLDAESSPRAGSSCLCRRPRREASVHDPGAAI